MSNKAGSEGHTASFIGNAIILLSLVSALICIFAFGRVDVPDGPYSTTQEWSILFVSLYAAAGVNGMFFGYLLAKVGSVLKRLEPPASRSSQTSIVPHPRPAVSANASKEELMAHYGVSAEGSEFILGTYRFPSLDAALRHARHQESLHGSA